MWDPIDDFERNELDQRHALYGGRLPDELCLDETGFAELWNLHPDEYHEVHLHGRRVKTPRWQQSYGRNYHYSGQVHEALPMPSIVGPLVEWSQSTIDPRLNGVLLVWYDDTLGHYIGKHRDSTTNMVPGAPIVTISFGAERVFRLRPWKGRGFHDFPTKDGRVFVMPYDTNLAWTHEVPKRASETGRRVSVTLRAFEDEKE